MRFCRSSVFQRFSVVLQVLSPPVLFSGVNFFSAPVLQCCSTISSASALQRFSAVYQVLSALVLFFSASMSSSMLQCFSISVLRCLSAPVLFSSSQCFGASFLQCSNAVFQCSTALPLQCPILQLSNPRITPPTPTLKLLYLLSKQIPALIKPIISQIPLLPS